MKIQIKTIALSLILSIIIVGFSSLAFASEKAEKVVSPELDVRITPLADTQVAVIFHKLEGEVVKVKIYDNDGSLIYIDKEGKGTSYTKKFNLEQYPAGKYTYKVSNDVYSVTKVIELD